MSPLLHIFYKILTTHVIWRAIRCAILWVRLSDATLFKRHRHVLHRVLLFTNLVGLILVRVFIVSDQELQLKRAPLLTPCILQLIQPLSTGTTM